MSTLPTQQENYVALDKELGSGKLIELGRGAFGTVYKGVFNNQAVAFKEVNANDPSEAQRIFEELDREIAKTSHLQHLHIAKSHCVAESTCGRRGIVVELVRGPTLQDVLKSRKNGSLLTGEVLRWGRQLAEAIDHYQQPSEKNHPIVHRDLKPSNVMIDEATLDVKIVDFGLSSRVERDGTHVTDPRIGIAGTLGYIPLEVFENKPWRKRGDIFSFAVILYQCLYGPHPFRPINGTLDEWYQFTKELPAYPFLVVPRYVWHVLRKGLDNNPECRHQTALLLIQELKEAISMSSETVDLRLPRFTSTFLVENKQAAGMKICHQQGVKSEMVLIPAQTFIRGRDESQSDIDHSPTHKVSITKSFFIDVYPVTNQQFDYFLSRSPYKTDSPWSQFYQNPTDADKPVRGVSYQDCLAYCEYCGRNLPTEAQWECAAKGGDDFLYVNSQDFDPTMIHCQKDSGPTPVGLHQPNVYGIHDMCGNVHEWVRDFYANNYQELRSKGLVQDPITKHGREGIVRGGCWESEPEDSTTVRRKKVNSQDSVISFGFRTILEVD